MTAGTRAANGFRALGSIAALLFGAARRLKNLLDGPIRQPEDLPSEKQQDPNDRDRNPIG
jgi:hypothetical protein